MSFRTWFASLQVARTFDQLQRDWRRSPRRRHTSWACLSAEVLEIRSLLSSYTAASVSALVADINAANTNGGANTITLAANTKFDLTAVNNITNGANGLPVISGAKIADNLTIIGNGATIDRSTVAGTPAFRLFDVANGNSLTLENVTLQNGLAQGSGTAADGGAVFNQGAVTLNAVTLQNNSARGAAGAPLSPGGDAMGGAIFSSGVLTLEGGTALQHNLAVGGRGGAGSSALDTAPNGGTAWGGGIYVAGGTATLSNAKLSNNIASGGVGGSAFVGYSGGIALFISGQSGNGFAGGLCVADGTTALTNATLSSNFAQGGGSPTSGDGGNGFGGALQVTGGTVSVRNSTLSFNGAKGANGGETTNGNGGNGFGGALQVSGGTVTLTSDTLSSNHASGGVAFLSGKGGNAFGGALQVSAGTVSVGNSTLSLNTAQGGNGGFGGFGTVGGNGFGGALEVNSGTLSLTSDTVSSNSAKRSLLPGQVAGVGDGGGLYIASGATVDIDAFTLAHLINNTAATSDAEIHGPYILRN